MKKIKKIKSFSFLSTIVCLANIFSGCAIVSFNVSVPESVPEGVVGKINDETIQLKLSNLELSAELQTYQSSGSKDFVKPLGVWLNCDTKDAWLTINPSLVFLKIGDKKDIKPKTYLGPAEAWRSPRAAASGCGPRRYHLGWSFSNIAVSVSDVTEGNAQRGVFKPSSEDISFYGKNCFMFWFDIEANPELNYTLSIKGIKKSGELLSIPEISFKKGTVTKVFTVP